MGRQGSYSRLRALAFALLFVALAGAPTAAADLSDPVMQRSDRHAGLSATRVAATHAPGACPAGTHTLNLEMGPRCVHGTADGPPPPGGPGLAVANSSVAPKCHGNGVNGPRIELLYMTLKGRPNRAAAIVPRIVNEWVPQMEATFRRTSKDQGRELGLRFWAPNCKIAVSVLEIDAELGGPGTPLKPNRRQPANIYNHAYRSGFDDANKRYLIWIDTYSIGACGVATLALDDSPSAINANNSYPGGVLSPRTLSGGTQMAIVFGHSCWGKGSPGAFVETHELLHALGAVQLSAPNSNHAGHCTDDFDIMCYADSKAPQGSQKTFRRCRGNVAALDCGMDDYFRVNPPLDSYLATHHNVADSAFLGDAVGVDLVPAPFPRP